MHNIPFKPELLAPAGNLEKLHVAIDYGADAVYLAGKSFSLRNFSGNFTEPELADAIKYAKARGVKTYLACNIFSRNIDQPEIHDFLEKVAHLKPDAVIIADPGILLLAKSIIPHIPLHLSTQANTTNINAVRFWQETGVTRINLARELPLSDIKQINQNTTIETEVFIHGAMCISYSGRCLLSTVLSGRDSNQGLCSHPCRWRYSVLEEKRPGEYHPIIEDDRGTYIFNSKDLCMIDHIPALFDSGVTSLKIEGRMKGISYLASTVKTYREAIDLYASDPENYSVKDCWRKELDLVYHRPYCTGFYFNEDDNVLPNYSNIHKGKIHSFAGRISETLSENRFVIAIKNKVSVEDNIEILPYKGQPLKSKVVSITNDKGLQVTDAQPNSTSILEIEFPAEQGFIVRKI
ncbi:Peptidase U32 [Desulfamplus magnetovallimortis]|uniref:Peptidase U32 n=1 Tax=Desulfamplus magnetovallimortis TaxID=1246637 RepID=A0A1W1H5T6_9BACT|nr:U32 family peptidase [Desulfamplus magnetovallimortis]SLM27796.1 Peptidase U32 [Desulfamplus magnetovallimortis]